MASLLTPTTALLYSYLDIDPNVLDSSSGSNGATTSDASTEPDLFAQAFHQHTNEQHLIQPGSFNKPHIFDPSTTKTKKNYGLQEPEIICISPKSLECAFEDPAKQVDGYSSNDSHLENALVLPMSSSSILFDKSQQASVFYSKLSPGSVARIERNREEQLETAENIAKIYAAPNVSQVPALTVPKERKRGRKPVALDQAARELKHKQFLERNRVAAGKCRQRKKQRIEGLEEKYNEKKMINAELKGQILDMEAEIIRLRDLLSKEHTGECLAGSLVMATSEMVLEDSQTDEKNVISMFVVDNEESNDDENGVDNG